MSDSSNNYLQVDPLATRSPLSQWFREFLPIAIILLLNPLLGMAVSFLQLLKASDDWKENSAQVINSLLATAIWISLVNITKTIASDQYSYAGLFMKVPERGLYSTVFESWGGTGKEPVYSFITWALYYPCFGNLRLFFFTLSMAIYLLHYAAAYKLFKAIGSSKLTLICGVLILTFFTQYFVMTLHIIRQMLATAVAIYAIVYRATEGKYNWWLMIAAPLIHTSALFLVVLSFIPWFYYWMNIRRIVITLACFIPIIIFSTVIGTKLGGVSGIEALSYAGNRLADEGASDGGSISLAILLTVFVPLGISAISVILRYNRQNYVNDTIEEDSDRNWYTVNPFQPLLPVAYIAILLMIFVLSFSKTPIIQYRFFYFSYSFVPLLLPLLLGDTYEGKTRFYQWAISLFFIVRFFLSYNESGFHYAPTIDLFVQPIYYYFTGNFSPLYLR